jgi:mannose-6-phosphate isomerase
VIDFNRGPITPVTPKNQDPANSALETLVRCEKFTLQRYSSAKTIQLPTNTFHILTVPKGSGHVDSTAGSLHLATGQSALIPYACPNPTLTLTPNSFALLASCNPMT